MPETSNAAIGGSAIPGRVPFLRPILAIETSCDETAAAVVNADGMLVAHEVYSQVKEHAAFGGVVPEVASRRHIEVLPELVEEVLGEAAKAGVVPEAVAVTRGPGLVGSLLVGVQFAQAWAGARRLPLLGVHHLAGHLHAVLLEDASWPMPYLALIVSGGHTSLVDVAGAGVYRVFARTVDDAAGEAFDKAARLLGLGYPGGPAVAAAAETAGGDRERLVESLMTHSPDFSFSGLKTALRKAMTGVVPDARRIAVLAASFQDAVVEALAVKVERALRERRPERFLLTGGVASNRALRERIAGICGAAGVTFAVPRPAYCTDNAAMIAMAARAGAGRLMTRDESADPSLEL